VRERGPTKNVGRGRGSLGPRVWGGRRKGEGDSSGHAGKDGWEKEALGGGGIAKKEKQPCCPEGLSEKKKNVKHSLRNRRGDPLPDGARRQKEKIKTGGLKDWERGSEGGRDRAEGKGSAGGRGNFYDARGKHRGKTLGCGRGKSARRGKVAQKFRGQGGGGPQAKKEKGGEGELATEWRKIWGGGGEGEGTGQPVRRAPLERCRRQDLKKKGRQTGGGAQLEKMGGGGGGGGAKGSAAE